MELILDTWTWIEYLTETAIGKQIAFHIKSNRIYTIENTLAEIYSFAKRENKDFSEALHLIKANSTILPVNYMDWISAAELKAEHRPSRQGFGIMDAILLAKAKALNAKILTGDPHFKGMKNVKYLRS